MKLLAPPDARTRAMHEAWAEFRTWLAWQERVTFTRTNGSTKLDVAMGNPFGLPLRVLVTPPPRTA